MGLNVGMFLLSTGRPKGKGTKKTLALVKGQGPVRGKDQVKGQGPVKGQDLGKSQDPVKAQLPDKVQDPVKAQPPIQGGFLFPKPGVCPKIIFCPLVNPPIKCWRDSHCPGVMKCCEGFCGNECSYPR